MYRIALHMLTGDHAKYLSLVIGLAFAVLLIAQQTSIFFGLLRRGTGVLQNIGTPDLWVADRDTIWISDLRAMDEDDLDRVRSVPGVAWAEPLFAARAQAELPDGSYQAVRLIGIDRSSLIGRPPGMVRGSIDTIRRPDAIILEQSSRAELNSVEIGQRIRLNDRRAVVTGFARAQRSFNSDVLIYTTFQNAVRFVPTGRDRLSLVLVGVKSNANASDVQARIGRLPGLQAFTRSQFQWRTIDYILRKTGIGINFGITVALGFIVGLIVAAATFHQFTMENIRQLAVLKAMGATRWLLVRLVLVQAALVGVVGFGIGVGAAGAFSAFGRQPGAELTTYFPWQLLVGTLLATLVCVGSGSILSLRRVFRLDPAIVFN